MGYGQYGLASELAPYASQINGIIGEPEPSTLVLGLLGGSLLLAIGWRRRRALAH